MKKCKKKQRCENMIQKIHDSKNLSSEYCTLCKHETVCNFIILDNDNGNVLTVFFTRIGSVLLTLGLYTMHVRRQTIEG